MSEYEHAILLSGGVDSAYIAAAMRHPSRSCAVFVDYGQPAAKKEQRAAGVIAKACLLEFRVVKVANAPIGDMSDWQYGACIVPARNLWLTALAAAFGRLVWIGAAPQDEREYEDCRLNFLDGLDRSLETLGKGLRWSSTPRHKRVELLEEKNLLEYCWSCYGPGPKPCGECASCTQ